MAPQKRVLFIVSQPYFRWRGSPIRVGFDVQALAEHGWQVDLLVPPFGEDRAVEGVRVVRVARLPGIRDLPIGPSVAKLLYDGLLYAKARRLLRANPYDVLHGVEDAGAVCALLARPAGARFVFEKHSDPSSYRKKGLRNVVMSLYAAVERWIIRRADAVIGTGTGLAQQARQVALQTPVYPIPDIPSSLAESTPDGIRQMRARFQRSPAERLVLYVGSFAVYQGIDLLFRTIPKVAAQVPQVRFVIVGGTPGEIDARRQALAAAGCADAVAFAGYVDPDVLPDLLAAADILLSPRIAGTNTPLKLLDYLKAGRAIVATEHAANRQILTEESAVFAAPEPDAFAAAIADLLQDAPRRQALSEAGAALIQSYYNFDVFRRKLGEVYANLYVDADDTP